MDIFLEELVNKRLNLDGTIADKIPQFVNYEYFHSKPDPHAAIHLTDEMIINYRNLTNSLYPYSSTEFASNGTFLRGCCQDIAKEWLVVIACSSFKTQWCARTH